MQTAKLILNGAGRTRSYRNKLIEARLAFNFVGATHVEIVGMYSKHLQCGIEGEDGLTACALNLFGIFPETMSVEQGVSLAAMQSAPGVLRNDIEMLNDRARTAITWLKTQGVEFPFIEPDKRFVAAPVLSPQNSPYRGFQPPTQCFDPESWTRQKLMTEAVATSLGNIRANVTKLADNPNVSIASVAVVARYPYQEIVKVGKWSETVPIEVGSILKPLLLQLYLDWLGVDKMLSIQFPVGSGIMDLSLKAYCPKDKGGPSQPVSLPTAIAKSINSTCVTSLVMLPYYIYLQDKREFRRFVSILNESEVNRFATWPDRTISANILSGILNEQVDPKVLPRELSYRVVQLAALRRFKEMAQTNIPGHHEVSELLSSILGAEIKLTANEIALLYARLFFPSGTCKPSATAELLKMRAEEGTLKHSVGMLGLAGKTGTTEKSAIVAVGLCLPTNDGKDLLPITAVVAATDHTGGTLGDLYGATLGKALLTTSDDLAKFGYDFRLP